MKTLAAIGCVVSFIVLASLPAASGTSPSPPLRFTFRVDGEPVVGRRVSVMVEATPSGSFGEVQLEVWPSSGLQVEGERVWIFETQEGETERRSWTIYARAAGPWTVGVAASNNDGGMGWVGGTLYGVSTATHGAAGPEPGALFGQDSATASSSATLDEDSNTVEVTYRAEGKGPFWSLGTTTVSAQSPYQQGTSQELTIGPGDPVPHRTVKATARLEPEGGFAFTLRTEWQIEFPRPSSAQEGRDTDPYRSELACSWHYVKRSDVVGFKEEAVKCGADSPWFIPGPTFAFLLLFAAASVLLANRRLAR